MLEEQELTPAALRRCHQHFHNERAGRYLYTHTQPPPPRTHQTDFLDTKLPEKLTNVKLLGEISIIKGGRKSSLRLKVQRKPLVDVLQPEPSHGNKALDDASKG